MYHKIALDQSTTYHARNDDLKNLVTQLRAMTEEEKESGEIEHRMANCMKEMTQAAVIAITFAAMSLEAFFYDYAAEKLGDKYVQKHLDKLDLKSKFLVYPRLVCGKGPDKSTKAYQSLDKLVAHRNKLVHFKSQPFSLRTWKRREWLTEGVDSAVECVMLVVQELDSLLGGGQVLSCRMKSSDWFRN
jgi:hypothetical protein